MIFNQGNIEPKKTNKNSSKINKYLLNFFNNLLENGNSPPYYKGMQRGKIPIILLVW